MTNAQRRRRAREAADAANKAGTRKHDPEGWKARQDRLWREYTAKAELMAAIRPGKPGYMAPHQQGRPRIQGHNRSRQRRHEQRAMARSAG